MRGALPVSGGKEHPYLWRQRDTENNLSKFPHFTTLTSYSLTWHTCVHCWSNQNSSVYSSLHFLMTAPMPCKIYVTFVSFLLLICLHQFSFQTHSETLRKSSNFFPPLQFLSPECKTPPVEDTLLHPEAEVKRSWTSDHSWLKVRALTMPVSSIYIYRDWLRKGVWESLPFRIQIRRKTFV